MRISIACDHAGFELKEKIVAFLEKKDYQVHDFGTYSSQSVDYPDYVHLLARSVSAQEYDFGILICGTGNGVSITANKYASIRCALCWNEDLSRLARQHNNANIIALPARFISEQEACQAVDIFLHTSFDGGRHQQRIDKIPIP